MDEGRNGGAHSPEYVAYLLFRILADIESKELRKGFPNTTDRSWILDSYAECLATVKNPAARLEQVEQRK